MAPNILLKKYLQLVLVCYNESIALRVRPFREGGHLISNYPVL